MCPTVNHVSSNGGHCAQDGSMDGWTDAANCSSRSCSPDVYTVRVHARVRAIVPIDRCVTPSALTVLSAKSGEETSYGLDGQAQAVLSPSTVKRLLEANKLPHKEGHAALPLTCPLCERETSQTVFINKTTRGLVCPPCKVHGELGRLGGPSGAVRGRGSNV